MTSVAATGWTKKDVIEAMLLITSEICEGSFRVKDSMIYTEHFFPINIDKPKGREFSNKLIFPIYFPWEGTYIFIDLEKEKVVAQYRCKFAAEQSFVDNLGVVEAITRRYRSKKKESAQRHSYPLT